MIPVIVIQYGLAQTADTDQDHILIVVFAQGIGKDPDQFIDIIAVALFAKLTDHRKIMADRRRLDIDVFR